MVESIDVPPKKQSVVNGPSGPFGKGDPRGGAMTTPLPTRRRSPGEKDEANGPKDESKSNIFQNAAESTHGNPGVGRNHGGRVATRPSHSDQWRRRFRKDTVRN